MSPTEKLVDVSYKEFMSMSIHQAGFPSQNLEYDNNLYSIWWVEKKLFLKSSLQFKNRIEYN